MKDKIVVIGGGGHAKVIINVLKKLGIYDILGYTDLIDKGTVLGIKYLGNDEILNDIIKTNKTCNAVIGVGSINNPGTRKKIYEKLKDTGFILPVIISNSAIINYDVTIDEGTVILDGGIINSGSTIGKCAIINTKAIVEHDCSIGDYVHLAAGAIAGGGVIIGDNTLIGVGAKVIQYKKICSDCFIGAGAIVIRDIFEPGNYFGIPSRKVSIKNEN